MVNGESFLLRYPFSHFNPGSEAPVLAAFAAAMQPGMIVFDVGANAGVFTLLAARSGAQVVAFEPSAAAAQLLRDHLVLNGLEAQIIEAVVADRDGEISFFEQGAANTSSISESSARTGEGLAPGSVAAVVRPAITLDSYCASTGLWPDLVKLDVEGAEAHALSGAKAWLMRRKGILLIEVHPWSLAQLGRSESDVLDLLQHAEWTYELLGDNGNTRHYRSTPNSD
jgi:FkbM family methyltransferase